MAKAAVQSARLFIAYAHEDEELQQRLAKHLAVLRAAGLVDYWNDRKIIPGETWDERIRTQLEAADVVLLLISADFIDSDYCMNVEFKRAIERQESGAARVIPVILRPTLWYLDDRLGRLQALPKDGEPVALWDDEDEALVNIAQGIKRTVLQLQGGSWRASGRSATPTEPPVVETKAVSPGTIGRRPGSAPAPRAATPPRPPMPVAISTNKQRRIVRTILTTVFWLVIGAASGCVIAWLCSEAGAIDTRLGKAMAIAGTGGGICGIALALFFRLRGNEGDRAQRQIIDSKRRQAGGRPAKQAAGELQKWRALAGRVYERKELYKTAFVGTQQRFARLRAVLMMVLMIAFANVFTFIAYTGVTLRYEGISGDMPQLVNYMQTLLNYGFVILITVTIFYRYRRQPSARRGLWSAILIGGFGTFLAGFVFLCQLTPEILQFMQQGPAKMPVLPFMPAPWESQGALPFGGRPPLYVPFVGYFVVQKLVILPGIATAVAVLMCPFVRPKPSVVAT